MCLPDSKVKSRSRILYSDKVPSKVNPLLLEENQNYWVRGVRERGKERGRWKVVE